MEYYLTIYIYLRIKMRQVHFGISLKPFNFQLTNLFFIIARSHNVLFQLSRMQDLFGVSALCVVSLFFQIELKVLFILLLFS
jgi:hypothetical protein